jgi:hypothetical protein
MITKWPLRRRRLSILAGRMDGRIVLIWPLVQDGPYLRFLLRHRRIP